MCAAVGTVSHQRGLEACTTYGRCGNMMENGKVVLNLSALK
jgi:hypothetical protein